MAGVAEVADAEVSKTSGSNPLRVRVPPPASPIPTPNPRKPRAALSISLCGCSCGAHAWRRRPLAGLGAHAPRLESRPRHPPFQLRTRGNRGLRSRFPFAGAAAGPTPGGVGPSLVSGLTPLGSSPAPGIPHSNSEPAETESCALDFPLRVQLRGPRLAASAPRWSRGSRPSARVPPPASPIPTPNPRKPRAALSISLCGCSCGPHAWRRRPLTGLGAHALDSNPAPGDPIFSGRTLPGVYRTGSGQRSLPPRPAPILRRMRAPLHRGGNQTEKPAQGQDEGS